jgi:3-dehydroquinate synthase
MIIKSSYHNYEIFFSDWKIFLEENFTEGDVIIVDKFFENKISHNKIVIQSLESSKEISAVIPIIDLILKNNFKKNNKIFALGGGVIQDISGFISSILFRGVDWYFIPTTLISQGDSCIGGKTSINLKNVKNQLGTNYPPLKICIDTNFLKTLPQEQIKSGLGEMLHYFIFSSENDFIFFKQNFEENNFKNLIQRSLEIKKSVIEIDEKEKGLRILFNYGHTFGHALESVFNYEIPHGIAVAKGMDISNFISFRMNFLNEKEYIQMNNILKKIYENYSFKKLDLESYYNIIKKDKKNSRKFIRPILIKKIGNLFQHDFDFDGNLFYILKEYFEQ